MRRRSSVLRIVGLAGIAALGVKAVAQEPKPQVFSQLQLSSEYRYDGVNNSSGNPSAQVSVYLWRPDHFYAGLWVASVDYSGYRDPDTKQEVVVYAGRKFEFGAPYFEMPGDNTRIQIEGMYTFYPDQGPPGPTYDFFQGRVSVAHRVGKLTLRAETAYVPQASYGAGFAWKVEGGAAYKFNDWLEVSGEYGYRESQKRADRSWWDIGATAKWGKFDFDLRWYDTDLDFRECNFSPNCDGGLVGKIVWNVSPW
jgi:uncharacterized protein (TIGR02001 family)